MHLSTRLDCDLVAVEQTDELSLLVSITAPTPRPAVDRQPATLQVVLDRSGSMRGARLEGAKQALISIVDRLDPSDNLGVVAFDDSVRIVVPAGPLTDKQRVRQAIAEVTHGGTTDLSSGYLRGLQEARRVAGPRGATLLLVSDGHANVGVTDPDILADVAAKAHADGVTTSALGFGLGYDEQLLAALARGGAGNELFAEEADTAAALIGGEVDGLLSQVAQAASLRVTWTDQVESVAVVNDLPFVETENAALLELGSFHAGETRRVLLKLRVPAIAALGLAQVATLEFAHVSLPDLLQHTTTLPVHVNVVPGDVAAGRIPDPEVRSEALFQQAQSAKRESSRLLSNGYVDEAAALLAGTSAMLRSASVSLPAVYAAELSDEADIVAALADESRLDGARAAKATSYESTYKSRYRGRENIGARLLLRWAADGSESIADASATIQEWQLMQLLRELPGELVAELRPTEGEVRDERTADAIATALGDSHRLQPFFAGASAHGGFTVQRL